MSRFDSVPAKPKEPINKVVVDGNFLCQTCGESVDEAFYLPEDHLLAWKCSSGHKSFVEKIEL